VVVVCLDEITLAMLHESVVGESVVLNRAARTPKVVTNEIHPIFNRGERSETMLLIVLVGYL
jgi:hypothetical protein